MESPKKMVTLRETVHDGQVAQIHRALAEAHSPDAVFVSHEGFLSRSTAREKEFLRLVREARKTA